MNIESIKLVDIQLKNLKNVDNGEINLTYNDEVLNMVGIYGQNGSGKTTVIDAINLCRNLLLGEELEEYFVDLLNNNTQSTVSVTFKINEERLISYSVILEKVSTLNEMKNYENRITILYESLETKELKNNSRTKNLITFSRNNKDKKPELKPVSYFRNNQTNRTMLNVAVKQSDKDQQSVIFSDVIKGTIEASKNKNLDELKECMEAIELIAKNIFVFDNKMSGLVYSQFYIPFLFSVVNKKGNQSEYYFGTIGLDALQSSLLEQQHYKVISAIIEQINLVLPQIIPKMKLVLHVYGEQVTETGEKGYRVELNSNRDGKQFPFRAESDGVKKIVSILSALIAGYNSRLAIVAIDELDSGVYEFLLGELLTVLSEGAKGQIIFTSHNLRPLETISERKIIFTTTDQSNRYVKAHNIKQSNNLRNVYLRDIQYKTGQHELYNTTSIAKIQRSFRKSSIIQEEGTDYE
ncbi:ATP-binding protein [Fundicoccus culcitae]|uniref:ATP-binding protein n=1 Tax=Fundicoccus culcitae TaxID=2969821 RepID=A0ABY5P9U7_9LACT|nr:ATP-binding protein [Fundicoccus culcitae]UUX35130.1 ATP-binding protein [Fundicoccus culcitae]